MNNKSNSCCSDPQKKRRPIIGRRFTHYPSGNPACIYPVQIRFRQCGKLPTSANQSVFLSLIWHSCQSHYSMCSIPKLLFKTIEKILADMTSMTSIGIEKCDLDRGYLTNITERLKNLINFHEAALKKCKNHFQCTSCHTCNNS